MWRKIVEGIKEKIALLRLMRPIAKIRLAILGSYGLVALVVMGMVLGKLSWTFLGLGIAAVIVYVILIVLETLNQ